MPTLHILDHPLLQHKISIMRDKNTGAKDFRELVNEVAMLMTYEATRDLPLREVTVETPIAVAKTKIIAGRKVAFVPIMRAGLGMLDGANALVPAAKVGHIGICRTKDNNGSECYYCKLPFDINERDVVVLDLMLATGMSAIGALEKIYESGAKTVKFVCVAASPEGVKAVQDAYPDVEIYTGALDAGLNEEQYITPGLGDGGDRIYGTK